MKMNRRNVLVGLGTIVAGGGAALGTGAFSSVEADRTVSVAVAGDASSALAFDTSDSNGNQYSDASSITNGTLELAFDSLGNSSGINLGAKTTFSPLFRTINNGSNNVNLSIYSSEGTIQTSPTILDSYNAVIENTINDGNGNSLTIEYAFTDENDNSIVGDGTNGSSVSLDATGGSDPNEEVSLVIGVADPGSSFDPSTTISGYLSEVTIVASSV
ncbi:MULTISPECIES: hypothetical protein [Natrinema]|uniref:hypothetical protein n=1 Tax=Natrinema TaxID=88723 RepID=UPI0002A80CA1|nr:MULTISPECIES: hypothetical protein [Natrinema]AFO58056.2 hypothetical protein NJ7G_2828 [Natrinema sp. J7-2]